MPPKSVINARDWDRVQDLGNFLRHMTNTEWRVIPDPVAPPSSPLRKRRPVLPLARGKCVRSWLSQCTSCGVSDVLRERGRIAPD